MTLTDQLLNLFQQLLASGRAFTMSADGSIQVPATERPDVLTATPSDIPMSDDFPDGDAVSVVPTAEQLDETDVSDGTNDSDLPSALSAVMALFADYRVLRAPVIRKRLRLDSLKAAQRRLARLEALGYVRKGVNKGEYVCSPVSAAGASCDALPETRTAASPMLINAEAEELAEDALRSMPSRARVREGEAEDVVTLKEGNRENNVTGTNIVSTICCSRLSTCNSKSLKESTTHKLKHAREMKELAAGVCEETIIPPVSPLAAMARSTQGQTTPSSHDDILTLQEHHCPARARPQSLGAVVRPEDDFDETDLELYLAEDCDDNDDEDYRDDSEGQDGEADYDPDHDEVDTDEDCEDEPDYAESVAS